MVVFEIFLEQRGELMPLPLQPYVASRAKKELLDNIRA